MTRHCADDEVGRLAHTAAVWADALRIELLVASSPAADRKQRTEALVSAYSDWPKLCRVMAELAEAAPRSADRGAQMNARGEDWRDLRRADVVSSAGGEKRNSEA